MLSLLSLLLTSGNVLRADTEQWTSTTYPNPKTNATLCNTWPNSTLCDPDHILTDQWRLNIHENLQKQMQKLRDTDILYNDNAPEDCHQNKTEGVKIYVILAKRIQTASNQSITDTDLTDFGNEVAEQYGLNAQVCKNFLIILGVEAAKLAYVRTGKDLKLPADLMERVFNQYTGFFNAKNYMEGLNNIINEIGEQMIDPFKDQTTTTMVTESDETSTPTSTTSSPLALKTQPSSNSDKINKPHSGSYNLGPIWMCLSLFFTLAALALLLVTRYQMKKHNQLQMQIVVPEPANINHDYNNTKDEAIGNQSFCDSEGTYGKGLSGNNCLSCEGRQHSPSDSNTGNTSLQISPVSFYQSNGENATTEETAANIDNKSNEETSDSLTTNNEKAHDLTLTTQPAEMQQISMPNFVPHSILKISRSNCEAEEKTKTIIKPTVISDDSQEEEQEDENITIKVNGNCTERAQNSNNDCSYVNIDNVDVSLKNFERNREIRSSYRSNLLSTAASAIPNTCSNRTSFYSDECSLHNSDNDERSNDGNSVQLSTKKSKNKILLKKSTLFKDSVASSQVVDGGSHENNNSSSQNDGEKNFRSF